MRRAIAVVLVFGAAAPAQGQVAPPGDDTIVVAFTGDTLIHPGLNRAAARNGSPYDFRPMFEPVRHLISGADFAICHLEVPLSPTSSDLSGYPRFNAPREVADGLAYAGFDACSTASNHSLDRGVQGLFDTIRILDEAGLRWAGTRLSALDYWNDTVYEVRGVRLANISATYWYNGLRPPRGMEWVGQLLDVDDILTRARRAKLFGVDLVVVSMHCCVEYRRMPTAGQLDISHRLIESPHVDLVVTHHSHVVGPVERVGDEFVLHGLGNFISGQFFGPQVSEGVIAMVTATRYNDVWRFDGIEVVPTQVTRGSYAVVPSAEGSPAWHRVMEAVNLMDAGIEPFPGHVRRGARLDLAD